jgi:DNA-binding MarR family transcriptional regulator
MALAPETETADGGELDARAQALTQHMARTCLGLRARAVSRTVTKLFDDELRAHGLRATQFVLVGAIQNLGPLTATELAQRLAMGRSTLSRNLRPLVEAGWVHYRKGRGRAQTVCIRDAGRRLLLDAGAAWERGQGKAEALLGESAAAQLTRLGTQLMEEHSRGQRGADSEPRSGQDDGPG